MNKPPLIEARGLRKHFERPRGLCQQAARALEVFAQPARFDQRRLVHWTISATGTTHAA